MNQTTPWSVTSVGERFVEYFRQLGFREIAGSSLLSEALPMTFVMSAGMVQFEKLAPVAQPGDRYVLIQNCFRHMDIETVRESSFHLSLFQMPGAFIFGPLDRQVCTAQIWELLTRVFGLDPQRLYVTYFRGGKVGGQFILPDEATAIAWQAVGVPAKHIVALGNKDNFWQQSARMVGLVNSRKCGPNTEIFFDRGPKYGCGKRDCHPGCSCGRFVEFLNHLFISLQVTTDGEIIPLENPFTETVIGRERLAALLNQAASVFDVDTIQPLVQQVECFDKFTPLDTEACLRHRRVIVDHLRALLFLFHDGAPAPGKSGRERLMRILARELLISRRLLGISDPGFLRSLTMLALDLYPHLTQQTQQRILEVMAEENARFEHTIQKGLETLERRLRNGLAIEPAELAKMEKDSGIPFDLLCYILWQKHIPVDLAACQAERQIYLRKLQAESAHSRKR